MPLICICIGSVTYHELLHLCHRYALAWRILVSAYEIGIDCAELQACTGSCLRMGLDKDPPLKGDISKEAGVVLQDFLSHALGDIRKRRQSWHTSHSWRARCNIATHSWELLTRHAPRVDIELRLVSAICKVAKVINDTLQDN